MHLSGVEVGNGENTHKDIGVSPGEGEGMVWQQAISLPTTTFPTCNMAIHNMVTYYHGKGTILTFQHRSKRPGQGSSEITEQAFPYFEGGFEREAGL